MPCKAPYGMTQYHKLFKLINLGNPFSLSYFDLILHTRDMVGGGGGGGGGGMVSVVSSPGINQV